MERRQIDRYSRQIMLEDIGLAGQEKLLESSATVVGAGGLGTPILTHLAAMGVGTLRIVDRDVIESTNLHRQTLYRDSDIGRPKIEAIAERLQEINPDCDIHPIPASVNRVSAPGIIAGTDIVIDALDSVEARYALNAACVDAGTPFVSGGAVGTAGQILVVIPGETACYDCVFPGLAEDDMPSCGVEGVNPTILSVIGGMEAAEAVRILCGQQAATLNTVLHVDLSTADFVKSSTLMVPECHTCGTGERHKPAVGTIIEELCGRAGGKRTFAITPAIPRVALEPQGYRISRSARGISLESPTTIIHIMEGGSSIVTGPATQSDALSLYESLTEPAS